MQEYDIIIIGGGITGAGIARLAAENGLKTALIEKNDFAYGTSSRSSKLIHGGLRYLQKFHFKLTRESSLERNLLMKNNPSFVNPVPFYFPLKKGLKHNRLYYQLGFILYDLLSGYKNFKPFQYLKKKRLLQKIPLLSEEKVKGSFLYYDAAVDDARLVIETIKSAKKFGANVFNYTKDFSILFKEKKVIGIRFTKDSEEYEFSSSKIVNATGIKSDEIRNMLDKKKHNNIVSSSGIHLLYHKSDFNFEGNITLESIKDGRPIFIMDWDPLVLIGTTDNPCGTETYYSKITEKEIDYIRETVDSYFPKIDIFSKKIIAKQSGIRPLIKSKKDTTSTKDVSREEAIFQDTNNLISIAGGKLTTYRLMSLKLLRLFFNGIEEKKSSYIFSTSYKESDLPKVSDDMTMQKLLNRTYGFSLCDIFENKLYHNNEIIDKTFEYAVNYEFCKSISDYMFRRFRLALWSDDHGKSYMKEVVSAAERHLEISNEEAQKMFSSYLEEVDLEEKIWQ